MTFFGTPSLTSSAATAWARRTDRPWLYCGDARGVGVAVHLDPRRAAPGASHRRPPLMICARPVGQRRLVPVEEYQVRARRGGRRRHLRGRDRHRRRLHAEGIAQPDQEAVAPLLVQLQSGRRAVDAGVEGLVVRDVHETVFGGHREAGHVRNREGQARHGLEGEAAARVVAGQPETAARRYRANVVHVRPLVADAAAEIGVEPGEADIEVEQDVRHGPVGLQLSAGRRRERRTGQVRDAKLVEVALQLEAEAVAQAIAQAADAGEAAVAVQRQPWRGRGRCADAGVLGQREAGTGADIDALERLRPRGRRCQDDRCGQRQRRNEPNAS